VREGLFSEEDLMTMDDEGRATDTEQAKAWHRLDMGPRVRAYQDGHIVHLEKRRRTWKLDGTLMGTIKSNYAAGRISPDDLGEMLAVAVELGA